MTYERAAVREPGWAARRGMQLVSVRQHEMNEMYQKIYFLAEEMGSLSLVSCGVSLAPLSGRISVRIIAILSPSTESE